MRSSHWKAVARQGRALIELCRGIMSDGSGALSDFDLEQLHVYLKRAAACYNQANDMEGMPNPPMQELEQLEEIYRERMDEHYAALEAERE